MKSLLTRLHSQLFWRVSGQKRGFGLLLGSYFGIFAGKYVKDGLLMITVNGYMVKIGRESDLDLARSIVRVSPVSTGLSVLLCTSRGTVLSLLRAWLSPEAMSARVVKERDLYNAIKGSSYLDAEVVFTERVGGEDLGELYRVYFETICGMRTYMPYGYNSLSVNSVRSRHAISALLKVRADRGFVRTRDKDGRTLFLRPGVDGDVTPEDAQVKGRPGRAAIPLVQYDLDYRFLRVWDSISEAAETLRLDKLSLGKAARGEYKGRGRYRLPGDNILGGYRWSLDTGSLHWADGVWSDKGPSFKDKLYKKRMELNKRKEARVVRRDYRTLLGQTGGAPVDDDGLYVMGGLIL